MQAQHQHVVLLVGRERHEYRYASADPASIDLKPHKLAHLHCSLQLARRVLQILEEPLAGVVQVACILDFREVPVDLLPPSVQILVLPTKPRANAYRPCLQLRSTEPSGSIRASNFVVGVDGAALIDETMEENTAHRET